MRNRSLRSASTPPNGMKRMVATMVKSAMTASQVVERVTSQAAQEKAIVWTK